MLRPEVIDLNDVVNSSAGLLSRLLGENIELRTRLDQRVGTTIADAGQMQQVIMNLVVNARDAMPDGGTVTIETSNAEITEDYVRQRPEVTSGPYVVLIVSDTGVGMS